MASPDEVVDISITLEGDGDEDDGAGVGWDTQLNADEDAWGDDGGWDAEPELGRAASGGSGWGDFAPIGDQEQQATVPLAIRDAVQADVAELRLVGRYEVAEPKFPGDSKIELRAGFPVSFLGLDKEQARAWTLDLTKMIVVKVVLPRGYFSASASEIQLCVGQCRPGHIEEEEVVGFSLSWTVEKRISRELLPKLTDPSNHNRTQRSDAVKKVHELIDMCGCSLTDAMLFLEESKYDVNAAAAALISAPELTRSSSSHEKSIRERERLAELESASADTRQLAEVLNVAPRVAELALASSSNRDMNEAANLLQEPTTRASLIAIMEDEKLNNDRDSSSSDQAVINSSSATEQAAAMEMIVAHNKFAELIAATEKILRSTHKVCILCGSPLDHIGLKPTICGTELCKFGQENLGIGFNLEGFLQESPEVADLLISAAVAAAAVGRMHFVTPLNVTATTCDGDEIGFRVSEHVAQERRAQRAAQTKQQQSRVHRGSSKAERKAAAEVDVEDAPSLYLDSQRVHSVLLTCPSVSDMKEMVSNGTLKADMFEREPLLYPLLRWIMASNRAHIRKLDPGEMIGDIPTQHQFVLLSSTPEKEAKFQNLRRAAAMRRQGKGSVYAFHGSSTANWHSILRIGLKVMSGTRFMTTGAAYGRGIYLAIDSGTALAYSRQGTVGWAKSQFGPSIKLMAICEIVNHQDLPQPNPHLVIPHDEWVCTRFIFVMPAASNFQLNIARVSDKLPNLA